MKTTGWIPYTKKIVNTYYLLLTKDSDMLPITTTKFEYKPCMNPDELSSQPGAKFYPLENDSVNNCTFDQNLKLYYDERYTQIPNFQVSEYQMQLNNGVISQLSTLPMYTKYIPAGTKENIFYKPYVRRTIPWKLECEASNLTSRSQVFTTYAQTVSWNPTILLVVHLTATALMLITVQCLIASCCTGYRALSYKNNRRFFLIQICTMGALQIGSIITCYIFVDRQRSANEVQIRKIGDLASTNNCTTTYNQVPVAALQAQVTKHDRMINHTLWPMSIALLVMICVNLAVIIFVCAYYVPSDQIDAEESDDDAAEEWFKKKDEDIVPVKPKGSKKVDSTKNYVSNDDVQKYMSERQYLPAIEQYNDLGDTESEGSYHYSVPNSP